MDKPFPLGAIGLRRCIAFRKKKVSIPLFLKLERLCFHGADIYSG
jgi:hypothetical protein